MSGATLPFRESVIRAMVCVTGDGNPVAMFPNAFFFYQKESGGYSSFGVCEQHRLEHSTHRDRQECARQLYRSFDESEVE